MKTVFTYEKTGYVAKLLKDGVCIGTWFSYDIGNLQNQVESWKATNLK
jgi:hypothetical protein